LTATSPRKLTIDLAWVQSATPGVTQNSIYRTTTPGTYSSSPLATINATTSYRDGTASRHTTYCYVATATSAGGVSARSNEACATAR
jgi:hypothetical protein